MTGENDPSRTWVCIGTGPSLSTKDINYCRSRKWSLATCNNAIFYASDSKIHHACDYRWWRMYGTKVRNQHTRLTTCCRNSAKRFGLTLLGCVESDGFAADPGPLYGQLPLSGYQLLQIVSWEKPDRIILLGYDMQHTDGKAHVHGDHPKDWPNAYKLENHVRMFDFVRPVLRIPVINCTRESALESFQRSTVDMLV
jgi:hypothetical protein